MCLKDIRQDAFQALFLSKKKRAISHDLIAPREEEKVKE